MRRILVLVMAVMLAAHIAPATAEPFGTDVTIDSGPIEGKVEDGILFFKGIPYAAPPLLDRRWQPPHQVMSWRVRRETFVLGDPCLQMGDSSPKPIGKEDCLFINVWRPAEKGKDEPLPVLVWIHGGGYVVGAGTGPDGITDGSTLAGQGLVVVTFNYRLGRLGFFAHPALAIEDPRYTGNFGYLDQIEALNWVKRNIGNFGGNPGQVTLVGESAGGASVLALLTSPLTTGLFHRAIVMSGGGRGPMMGRKMKGGTPQNPSAEQLGTCFAVICNIGSGPDALEKLRALAPTTLVGDLNFLDDALELLKSVPAQAGTPMIDCKVVVDEPGNVLSAGHAARVPLIIGTTDVEPPLYFPPKQDGYPYSYFGSDYLKAIFVYGFMPTIATINIGMDMSMHEPARFAARMITKWGNPAWLYRFSYVPEKVRLFKQASHADDVPFLFQTLDKIPWLKPFLTENDWQASRAFSTYLANFAKGPDGNPDTNGWPKLDGDPTNFNLMRFTESGPMFGEDPLRARIELVQGAAERRPPRLGCAN